MKKLFVFLFLFCSIISSFAGTVIKLGSIAPSGSLWDIKLKEIASEWKNITNGESSSFIWAVQSGMRII